MEDLVNIVLPSLAKLGETNSEMPVGMLLASLVAENLVSKDKCTCVFSAPGNVMKIDEQNPPTDLLLMIKRSQPSKYNFLP